jgi:pimeloyl-ACP methyl ester carboxylesterase
MSTIAHVAGVGPSVVLLHGLGGAARNWGEVVPLLVERYRVVALDLPGHGSAPSPAGRSLSSFVEAVSVAIEAERATPAFLVGHSFGGHVAASVAATRPELVRGLLLVAASGIGTLSRGARVAVHASTLVRPGRVPALFSPRLAGSAWFRRLVFRPFLVSDADALSASATHGFLSELRNHVDTRTAGRAMLADDPRFTLGSIRCPSLVLWGARDAQLPLDDAFDFTRRLGARLRVVADCGHLVIGERPDAVADALDALHESCGPG